MLLRAFAIGLLGAFMASLWLRAPALDATYFAALHGDPAQLERCAHRDPARAVERAASASASAPASASACPSHGAAALCRIAPAPVNVIDVAAAAATPALVFEMIRLAPHERVSVIGEQRFSDDLAAGAALAEHVTAIAARARAAAAAPIASPAVGPIASPAAGSIASPAAGGTIGATIGPTIGPTIDARGTAPRGSYVDVAIEGLYGDRRVLVLFH